MAGILSTDPALLDVELPRTLIESPSVSTFLPEEEASTCPLLSSNTVNGTLTPVQFSHPLTPNIDIDNESSAATNLCQIESKIETCSTSGSSTGIGMDGPDNEEPTTSLFTKHAAYQHLANNNNDNIQEITTISTNGNLNKDTPSFVSWNWPLIRKCTFFAFMSSLLAMIAIVIAMIATLPKSCNPKTAWYRGGVMYEIFPASFQDSNNDGVGDIRGIKNRLDYFTSLGISIIRLNSIFPSEHYPEDYENITSLMKIADILGNINDIHQLSESLHARNMSLILDFPLQTYVGELTSSSAQQQLNDIKNNLITTNATDDLTTPTTITTITTTTPTIQSINNNDDMITEAIKKWISYGIDGFYIKGIDDYIDSVDIISYMKIWKHTIGTNRALMISETLVNNMEAQKRSTLLKNIDLVDVQLNVLNGTKHIQQRLDAVLIGDLKPQENGPWISWSIGGVDKGRLTKHLISSNITMAATLMQLMLPGTPSIFYGDEIALETISDIHNEHMETKHLHHLPTMQWSNSSLKFTNRETLPWLPKTTNSNVENFKYISKMILLRAHSPSLYKNSICKMDATLKNTQIRHNHDDILIVERIYPRRFSFVSISNFGEKVVTLDMSSMYYSGNNMLSDGDNSKILFKTIQINALETVVVRLDK